ncbi:unnamed protein product, partial [Rhizoctonia solani]
VPSELQNLPHDSTLLSEEWMFNMDDFMVAGGVVSDITSLPSEPGQVNLPSDWNDAMEYLFRLDEGGPML